jgi:UDP-glucose 4-epimerase
VYVTYRLTGGARAWKGDAPFVLLDTGRIKALGWQATTPIADGIRRTVRYLVAHPELLDRR